MVLILMTASGAANLLAAPEPHAGLQIFLLIGQSNMAGRGVIEPMDREPVPRVRKMTPALTWAPACDPLHFDKPAIAGVGPGLAFARCITERDPQMEIGLVPAAVGGTSLAEWAPGGKLYTDAVTRARKALECGQLAGILWHQGEADSAEDKVASYAARFEALIKALRADLMSPDVPVIVGETGRFRKAGVRINRVLSTLPLRIAHCAFVDAEGLTHGGDGTHFDRASAQELGRRYAAVWLRMTAR